MASLLATSSCTPESPESMINPATNLEPMAQTGEASSSSTKGKERERENWKRSITEMMSSITDTLKHLSRNQSANMQSTNTRNPPIDNIQSADIIRPTMVIELSLRLSSRQSSSENSEPSTWPATPLIPSYRSVSKPLIKLRPPKPFLGKEATLEKFLF